MEQRKVVTVLFCDIVGSTALGETVDPEALRALLARYFDRMKQIVERHGGTVEKFIGDAVMAVFGVPAVHEDDALRAVRAAAEMRESFDELDVEGRIGVNTGEVVTGTEERLATGDAVNIAARLQQAAGPGEILLGETTVALTRDVAETARAETLELKGKSAPVAAWRLVSVTEHVPERRFDSPFVGRAREVELLERAAQRAQTERRCESMTIIGSAGVGKSRLVAEFLAHTSADVVRARCLSYGEDITYWPVVEVLKQLEGRAAQLDPAAAKVVAGLLGEGEAPSTDEIAWAFRKLLEAVAEERPLIAVFDDIQWAADTFLDLLEHIAVLSSGSPILLLCMARSELLDRRPGWEGVLRLEPLGAAEVGTLIDARTADLDAAARERILGAAGGNPLFVEEMTAMLQDTGGGDVAVPPTIHALLAARLDQLEANERAVLEHGAIEGEVFHRGGVQALTPEESRLTTRLTALVRRDLVRPDKAIVSGEDAYRFRHLLVRDAAYDATPKVRRAALHELFASWLDEHAAALVELDELVGYHLEQAVRYRRELGESGSRVDALSREAAKRLRLAGMRAMHRHDMRATAALLERAAALQPDTVDAPLAMYLAFAYSNLGANERALGCLADAADQAANEGKELDELKLRLDHLEYQAFAAPNRSLEKRLRSMVAEALPRFEAAGDQLGLAVAYGGLFLAEEFAGRSRAAMVAAADRLAEHGQRAGHRVFAAWGEQQAAAARRHGPMPVEECLVWFGEHPMAEETSLGLGEKAVLLAMLGRFDEAHGVLDEREQILAERGLVRSHALAGLFRSEVAALEGAHERALDAAREACARLDAVGQSSRRVLSYAMLAAALHRVGRDDEAKECLDLVHGSTRELISRIVWAQTDARVRRSEELAREAVADASDTDMLNLHADALVALAEVLRARGTDARAELERALALYEQKGNVVMAGRVRSELTDQSIKLL